MPGVAKIWAVDRNRLALNLIRPTRVIAVASDCQWQVSSFGNVIWLAVVQGFELRQLLCVRFDKVRQSVQQAAALRSGHLAPSTLFKSVTGCMHGFINVGSVGLRDVCNELSCCRINRRKRLTRCAIDPLAIDQQFSWADFHLGSCFRNCDRHLDLLECWKYAVVC